MWSYHQDTGNNRFGGASLQGVDCSSMCHKYPYFFNSTPCSFHMGLLYSHTPVCTQLSDMGSIHAVLFLTYTLVTHVFRDIVSFCPAKQYVTKNFTLKQYQYEVFQIET